MRSKVQPMKSPTATRLDLRGMDLNLCLLGFRFRDNLGFEGMPQCYFKPSGLMIWGAPLDAVLEQAVIGCEEQVLISMDPVPARFFALADSYEQIAKLLDAGKEPPNWCNWRIVQVGNIVQVRVRGADGRVLGPPDGVRCCMWGTAV